ncbi:AMP-binding enzyme, partial [Knoellia aerolata]|uniref:AMP-binding enzyme n=1 Tax=Knoellia aerolata TaxID=442954 RepID=UPI000568BD12
VVAVVTTDAADFDTDAAREFCRSALAAYKVPRRIVVVDELPRSQIGKVLRRQVRNQLLADPT